MKSNAVLTHLTYAAQSLQAAFELAQAAGDRELAARIRAAADPTASAIQGAIVTRPIDPRPATS